MWLEYSDVGGEWEEEKVSMVEDYIMHAFEGTESGY